MPRVRTADAKLLRELLAAGRLPECYIPPPEVLSGEALLDALGCGRHCGIRTDLARRGVARRVKESNSGILDFDDALAHQESIPARADLRERSRCRNSAVRADGPLDRPLRGL